MISVYIILIKQIRNKMKQRILLIVGFLVTCHVYSQVGINSQNPQGVFHVDAKKNNPPTGLPTGSQLDDDVVISTDGQLGIGTNTPTTKLHVKAPSNPLRLEGLVNGQKTDSVLTVDTSTGIVRIRKLVQSGGGSASSCSPNISAGVIAHNQPYGCTNYDPGAFISSAADPGIGGNVSYTWQQSIDNGVTWTPAQGSNSSQNYDPPGLAVPTKYRRAATNYCGAAYSNAVDIAINGLVSGIAVAPCSMKPGESSSLSVDLFTGSTVVNWTVSPSAGFSFSSTNTAATTLTASSSVAPGDYIVTATITNSSCGGQSFTKTITIVPTSVDLTNLKRSCKEILDSGLSTGNGVYWIDPDGTSNNAYCAEQVYCNMTDNGGGWTLILKSMTDNADFRHDSSIWASGATFNTSDYDISNASTANALYDTYNYLPVREFYVDFVTTPDLTPFSVTTVGTPKALANAPLNTNIANQYLNQPCQTSGMNSTYFSPPNAYSYESGGVGNGVNIGSIGTRIRFGVISNNENNEIFNTPDSGLGIGVLGLFGSTVSYGSGNVYNDPGVVCPGFTGTNGKSFYKALLWAR